MGKIFSNDREYKSKYYGSQRKPTQKQLNALQEWNQLQKQVGREAARAKKRSERALKSQSIKLRQSNNVATHEAVKSIMDLVQEGAERDRLRADSDLMYNLIDYTTQLATESESNTQNLFTYSQVNEMFNKWESALDEQSGKPSPF